MSRSKLLVMHAPDGFLTVGTAVATGVISTSTIGVSVARAKKTISDKQVPLAGISAAFVFAAQMFNFPVAAGTTGHLLGGALAAILLGPSMGAIVVSVVVAVQALAFADGGLTALGYNVLNMAIVTAFGGYALYRLLRKLFPANGAGVVAASGIAAGLSVALSSMAFSVEWLFGASAPVPFDTVFGAMVGVHLLIGVGEGIITAMAIGAVMAARPDLVYGAKDLNRAQMADRAAGSGASRVGAKAFAIGGVLVAVLFATVVSQFAADSPDGLERAAAAAGFESTAQDHALDSFIFSDYATAGVGNESLSLALAGLVGVLVTGTVGVGLAMAVRERKEPEPEDLESSSRETPTARPSA